MQFNGPDPRVVHTPVGWWGGVVLLLSQFYVHQLQCILESTVLVSHSNCTSYRYLFSTASSLRPRTSCTGHSVLKQVQFHSKCKLYQSEAYTGIWYKLYQLQGVWWVQFSIHISAVQIAVYFSKYSSILCTSCTRQSVHGMYSFSSPPSCTVHGISVKFSAPFHLCWSQCISASTVPY